MKRTPLLALTVVLAAGSALAGPARDTPERIRDNAETRQDHRQTRDDLRDLDRLESLVARFDEARARHDDQKLRRIDREIYIVVTRELREGRREVAGDRAEARRSTREMRRDDGRDARREREMQQQRLEIAGELSDLYGSNDRRSLNRKRELLGELVTLARRENRG